MISHRPTRSRALAVAALALLAARAARAEDPFHFPGHGTRDLGRAGASTARADDAHAVALNPANLARVPRQVRVDGHLSLNHVCYQRSGFASTLMVGPREVAYPEVCNESTPTVLPLAAGSFPLGDRLGLGVGVAPPLVYGRMRFPSTVPASVDNPITGTSQEVQIAAPQRFMLLEQDGVLLNLYLGAGYALTSRLRLGATFVVGGGRLKLGSGAMSLPSPTQTRDDPTADIRADVEVTDPFIPGVVVGVGWSPLDALDVGLTVTAQEAFDGRGDLTARENYWTVSQGLNPNPTYTRSSSFEPDMARFRLHNPLMVKLGAAWRFRRATAAASASHDPTLSDHGSVEVGVVYTRTSVHRTVMLRFPERPVIQLTDSGGAVPQNADVPVYLKGDSLGLRASGEVVLVPSLLLGRLGVWYEPDVQRPEYLNVTQLASERIGLTAGADVRLGPVTASAGYALVLFGDVGNGGDGAARAISGSATANPPYRTPYAINGGAAEQRVHLISLGASYAF